MSVSIIKHPIVLSIIVGVLVFAIMSYFYSDKESSKSTDRKKTKDDKSDKKKSGYKETIIISSAIATLLTWFVASTYLVDKEDTAKTGNPNQVLDVNAPLTLKGGSGQPSGQIGQLGQAGLTGQNTQGVQDASVAKITQTQAAKPAIPHISSEDPTRSYNLIGSGLNIPRADLKIPQVLIDYK